MLPFCARPLTRAGNSTISGASAYDFGSVRGRKTLRWTLFSSCCSTKLLSGGGAGVIVRPAFCVNARRSLTVAGVMVKESLPEPKLKSTTSSTSILAI